MNEAVEIIRFKDPKIQEMCSILADSMPKYIQAVLKARSGKISLKYITVF